MTLQVPKISIDGISHKKPNNFSQDIDLISTLDKKGLGTEIGTHSNIVTLAEWLNIASICIYSYLIKKYHITRKY